jgi:hypothetical protein
VHYLESWGDATTSDGTLIPIQPLIQPLFGGITELEFLARLLANHKRILMRVVRATFGSIASLQLLTMPDFLADGSLTKKIMEEIFVQWFRRQCYAETGRCEISIREIQA